MKLVPALLSPGGLQYPQLELPDPTGVATDIMDVPLYSGGTATIIEFSTTRVGYIIYSLQRLKGEEQSSISVHDMRS